jgi:pyrroloquinoline quinone biosynthesis protein B
MKKNIFISILGVAQDAGIPQCGCMKDCCRRAWKSNRFKKMVSSLGIVDKSNKKAWIIDATPDFKFQWHNLCICSDNAQIEGLFLTHGHVGHISGVINLEKAVMNSHSFIVWAMPKLRSLIRCNLPWKSLVDLKNIKLMNLINNIPVNLTNSLSIMPILVPHRDEFSETVGFIIKGPNKKILFLPDIDSWDQFPQIDKILSEVDQAFLDGTFFSGDELPGRDMSKVSHPTILTSMKRLACFANKISFIHLNHTNPVLFDKSAAFKVVSEAGFSVAKEGDILLI